MYVEGCVRFLILSGIKGFYDLDKLFVLEAFHDFAVFWYQHLRRSCFCKSMTFFNFLRIGKITLAFLFILLLNPYSLQNHKLLLCNYSWIGIGLIYAVEKKKKIVITSLENLDFLSSSWWTRYIFRLQDQKEELFNA